MKKAILLQLLFLLLFKPGYSQQPFCPSGATWYYEIMAGAEHGYAKRSFVKDTLIKGFPGQKVKQVDHLVFYTPGNYQIIDSSYLYFYENAGIVYGSYYINAANFDTLYNFNAVPGDRWGMFFGGGCTDTLFVQVFDTGHVFRNNQWLKFKLVTLAPGSFSDTLVERIGYLTMDPFNINPCIIDAASYSFCSYKDSSFTIYPHPDSVCTFLPDGIKELSADNSFLAYPNPAHDLLTIKNEEGKEAEEVTLFDIAGRIVFSKEITQEAANTIDVSKLTAGMYFIELKSKTVIKRTLLVKE